MLYKYNNSRQICSTHKAYLTAIDLFIKQKCRQLDLAPGRIGIVLDHFHRLRSDPPLVAIRQENPQPILHLSNNLHLGAFVDDE